MCVCMLMSCMCMCVWTGRRGDPNEPAPRQVRQPLAYSHACRGRVVLTSMPLACFATAAPSVAQAGMKSNNRDQRIQPTPRVAAVHQRASGSGTTFWLTQQQKKHTPQQAATTSFGLWGCSAEQRSFVLHTNKHSTLASKRMQYLLLSTRPSQLSNCRPMALDDCTGRSSENRSCLCSVALCTAPPAPPTSLPLPRGGASSAEGAKPRLEPPLGAPTRSPRPELPLSPPPNTHTHPAPPPSPRPRPRPCFRPRPGPCQGLEAFGARAAAHGTPNRVPHYATAPRQGRCLQL